MKKDWLGLAAAMAIFLGILGVLFLLLRLVLPKRKGRDFYLPRIGDDFYLPKVHSDFYVPKVGRGFYVPRPRKR